MSVTREQVAAVVLEPVTVLLDRELVRFFARTIGERGGVHDDLDVARASGHRDLVVPPTYFFTIENQRDEPLGDLSGLDLDPARILHEAPFRSGGRGPRASREGADAARRRYHSVIYVTVS